MTLGKATVQEAKQLLICVKDGRMLQNSSLELRLLPELHDSFKRKSNAVRVSPVLRKLMILTFALHQGHDIA